MTLQTQKLVMVGLAVSGDVPPNLVQPPLVDGIHLRWAFKRELGSPSYGYYLIRRPHRSGELVCLSSETRRLKEGRWLDNQLATAFGRIISDRNLVLTDAFPPSGSIEFDLNRRGYLRFGFPPQEPVRRIEAQIGFRKGVGDELMYANFKGRPEEMGPNPCTEQEVEFTVRDHAANLPNESRIWVGDTNSGPLSGLDCGFELEVALPRLSAFVELTVTHFVRPAMIDALDENGAVVDVREMQNAGGEPETLRLRGEGIVRLVVHAPQNETLLHDLCFGDDPESETQIRVIALLGRTPVDESVARGRHGQVVSVSLEFDAISAVVFGDGPAALIDLCFIPVSQDATTGWQPMPDFPYPICLPVRHPDYPCSGWAPEDPATAEALALRRVLYGSQGASTDDPFGELHDRLLGLVVDGPGRTPMADRSSPVLGTPDAPDPGIVPRSMPNQHPLDLVLLGALHPALAQMVGLYWADQTVDPGVAYDYLIIADYNGRGELDPDNVLSIVQETGFDEVDGWIVFNKRMTPASPLPPPNGLRVYALPGSSARARDGNAQDASNENIRIPTTDRKKPYHSLDYHLSVSVRLYRSSRISQEGAR